MSLREWNRYINEIFPACYDDLTTEENTARNAELMSLYYINRLLSMFKYEGLPETIPARYLEGYLLINGSCCIASHGGKLYALKGGLGGEPDAYYMPQEYIVANPYLKLNKTYILGEDAILCRNDDFMIGLLPIIRKYCSAMAANEQTMAINVIYARIQSIITGTTDATVEAANEYLMNVKKGKLGAVLSEEFFEGIKTQPYQTAGQHTQLTQLIEYEQYNKASLYNELGLNANYNMKRESINSNESQLNDDMLTPLIDNMLRCRKEFCEGVNNMFGTDISVDFNSAWKENEQQADAELEMLEKEAENAAELPASPDESGKEKSKESADEVKDDEKEDD